MADHPFNILSLCTGMSMLDEGLRLVVPGARVICGVEHEAFAVEVLARRMEEACLAPFPVWSNLRTFDGRPWRGVVDCLTAGYPCQPFSHAGRRRGERDPRHLWPDVARVIEEAQPDVLWMENVAGHLSLGFDTVREQLEGMGYRVTAGLFTAAEVGAPQKRARLFILGVMGDPDRLSEFWGSAPGLEGQAGSRRQPQHDDQVRPGRDVASEGQRGVADPRGQRPQGEFPASPAEAPARPGRGVVADPEGQQGRVDAGQRAAGPGASDAGGPGDAVFPPGPGDADAWREILEHDPALAPAVERGVRGVADGVAPRMDRLRACGNGVVALAAAYAFASLWACLKE